MRIEEPRAELVAYTQLPPGHRGQLGYDDPCTDMAMVIEAAGRTSWKSEAKIAKGSADGFCVRVVNVRRDESIAEHCSVTLRLVTDRYASHQLVRHRIAAYTQESTHYINYGKVGNQIHCMRPLGIQQHVGGDPKNAYTQAFRVWMAACEHAEAAYFDLLDQGVKHYHARFVLPGCLKTEVVATYNLRMWRHVVAQRITPNNTPEIVRLMELSLPILNRLCPPLFEDLAAKYPEKR